VSIFELSFWVTRADFVRQYEKIGDFWLPAKDETFVDVKLYGKKILSIEHLINTVNGVTNTALVDPRTLDILTTPVYWRDLPRELGSRFRR
jgi:hypothetical protein